MRYLLVTLFLFTSLFAADKKLYIGAGIGVGAGQETLELSSGTTSTIDYDATSSSVKVGYIFESENRIEVSSISIDADAATSTATFSGSDVDWIFTAEPQQSGEVEMKPFLILGLGSYEYKDFLINQETLKGVSVNYGLGAYITVTENVEFEAAFKAKAIAWQQIVYLGTTYSYAETMYLAYIGANIKF